METIMKLPQVQEATKYTGLYVVDFGDHSGVGFTAAEVAELLESEQYADAHVYKIHRAFPDGTMELKGVATETFSLEAGMFFYADDEATAQDDFARLVEWADRQAPPARCKVQLAQTGELYVTALIYPAECDNEFARWLLAGDYRTAGTVEGGTGAVNRYYDANPRVLESRQLWTAASADSLHGEALFEAAKRAIVR